MTTQTTVTPESVLAKADLLRPQLGSGFRDEIVQSLYAEAEHIAGRAVSSGSAKKWDFDQRIDRLVTSPIFGLPIMFFLLAAVFWITIVGANVPSQMIATGLVLV